MIGGHCGTCRFCTPVKERIQSQTGEREIDRLFCHGAPPSPVLNENGSITFWFPVVRVAPKTFWCGAHRLNWRFWKWHEKERTTR